ncbi:hotdog domain-containing protein [Yinghuangia sp. YIM S10712]|uniref:hotdog domain-containing protein n=1 Tax=Yinghuangia sp. YIM S10712 TaxID=3436930 RepID=UPI003F53A839
MCVPGTSHLRTSVLVVWADIIAGHLAAHVIAPRVPVTLELDVHLFRRAPGSGVVRAMGRTVKAGRSVFVAEIEFVTESGEPVAVCGASFMAQPDTSKRLPVLSETMPVTGRLSVPLAERAGCVRREPGVAVLPRSEDGTNASNTVNGGLIALATEEAVLSLVPGDTLSSLGLRYLAAVRTGPAVATARIRGGGGGGGGGCPSSRGTR